MTVTGLQPVASHVLNAGMEIECGDSFLSFEDWLAGKRTSISVKAKSDGWRILGDGSPLDHPAFPESNEALAQAFKMQGEATRTLIEKTYAHAGLDPAEWDFKTSLGYFQSKADSSVFVSIDNGRWRASAGTFSVTDHPTAQAALDELKASPVLASQELWVLEQICGHLDGAPCFPGEIYDYQPLADKGWISLTENGDHKIARLLPSGIEAMDNDPRTMPQALKEIILAEAEQDEGMRREWNNFLSVYHNPDNPIQLLEAFTQGWDLSAAFVDSEPCEICVKADSRRNEAGPLVRNLTVALFSPTWADDNSASQKLAEAIARKQNVLVEAARALTASEVTLKM